MNAVIEQAISNMTIERKNRSFHLNMCVQIPYIVVILQ